MEKKKFKLGLLPKLFLKPKTHVIYAKEGFIIVAFTWIMLSLVGAVPLVLAGAVTSYADAFFETVSGFTTTGASILTDIESMPRGVLFWRSFTHWLGGMGVLVLATAVLPSMGIRSHYLTQAETPGPVFSKLVPKQSTTSKILYSIYFGLTAVETVLLKIAGMPWYDAVIHALSSAGTGGFSNRNASVGAYGSVAIDLIITVFILLFSVNFAVYFLLLTRKFRDILASDELRFFLTVRFIGPGERTAIPPFSDDDGKFIFRRKEIGDIISLYLQAVAIGRPAGRKDEIADAFSI